jgi:DNA-binding NarL/FixJ family response regulator
MLSRSVGAGTLEHAMSAPSSIRYLTIDCQPIVHGGVRHLLGPFDDLQPVGEAFDLDEALQLTIRFTPDLALVEIADLGADWAAGLRRLGQALPSMRLVALSASVDPVQAREALGAGAVGYLLKGVQALTLAQALRSVVTGHQVLAPEVTNALMASHHVDEPCCDDFSQREREVLTLLARGLSNSAIATRLYISKATVKFHCGNIFNKLGVHTRAEALVQAFEYGLVPRLVARSAGHTPNHERLAPVTLARRA